MSNHVIASLSLLVIFSFVAYKIYRRARRSEETLDISELRRNMAKFEGENSEEYRKEVAPYLDSWTAKYGDRVPLREFEKFNHYIAEQAAKYGHLRRQMINQRASAGETIEIAELRKDLQKTKAEYQGADRDQFIRQLDMRLESLEAKYGDSIPIEDAYRIVDQLRDGSGDD